MNRSLRGLRSAAVLLPVVLDAPVAARLVKAATRSPVVETATVAGVTAGLARPPGAGPWPAYLFLTGAHPLRRREPIVERLMVGLARAGYLAVTPDLPGLDNGEITVETLEAATAVAQAIVGRRDVRGHRVALLGASTGASLSLLVAARPEVADHVSVVIAVTPFADVEKIICLATTGAYDEGDGGQATRPVSPLLRRVVVRSLIAALPPDGERERLLSMLPDTDDEDVLAQLRSYSPVREEDAALLSCLLNVDSARFGPLYEALPSHVRRTLERLSPLRQAPHVRAPVELIVPPTDEYFPIGEALTLAGEIPDARLTMTATLDHTRPGINSGRIVDLIRFGRFAVRGLAAARVE